MKRVTTRLGRDIYEQNARYVDRYMKFFMKNKGDKEKLEKELKRIDNQWKEWLLRAHGPELLALNGNMFATDIYNLLKVGNDTQAAINNLKNNSQNT